MSEPLRCVPGNTIVTGWDFSTGAVKCLAFDVEGTVVAECRFPTDLWTEGGVSELGLLQLEGQARATTREIAALLREHNRLANWAAGGISATHHTSGRIDKRTNQVRRAICWNDQTLADYHKRGLERLGGPDRVLEFIGGPWAIRYSLSHLVKDEVTLKPEQWQRTWKILPHGPLAAGYLTGRFDVTSVSSAASTGLMDLRSNQWRGEMLACIESEDYRRMAWEALPRIIDGNEPIGRLSDNLALESNIPIGDRPRIYPTLDDQAAGLVGGGAVDAGQLAIILGNSAVVNSSADYPPRSGNLDAMKLNWGPYLWMRCYSNGAQFLDKIVGPNPDWDQLEAAARHTPPGCNGTAVLPFALSEPSLGIHEPRLQWFPAEPSDIGTRFRAALEALAYLVTLGVWEHEAAGQTVSRITVSGGIARSKVMCEILATLLDRPLERLQSDEGPALGAAVTALAALETRSRRERGIRDPYSVANAVEQMVRFREAAQPVGDWKETYRGGIEVFKERLKS